MKPVWQVNRATPAAIAGRAVQVAQLAALCAAQGREAYVLDVGSSSFITFDAETHAELVRQFNRPSTPSDP